MMPLDIIILFNGEKDYNLLNSLQIEITGESNRYLLVYAKATREQILKLSEYPQIRYISHSGIIELPWS